MRLTPLDRAAARRAFDRAAPTYEQHAVLQREVEQRLLERLAYFRIEASSVLDLGCGTGRSLARLHAHQPGSRVIGLDWSPGMLLQLRAVRGAEARAVCADMLAIPLAVRSVDLVFSNLALAWCPDLDGVFSEVRRVLRPGGLFVFSTFGPDTLPELKAAWADVDSGAHVHAFEDMHDVGDRLVAAGFRDPVMDREDLVMEYADVDALMQDLKGTGSRNVAKERTRGLTGKGKIAALRNACAGFSREGRCPASFEIVFGAAFGPAAGQPVRTREGEVATFPVDSLRRGGGRRRDADRPAACGSGSKPPG